METPIDDFGSTQLVPGYRNYAGFWLRFLAAVIDALILNIASTFVTSPILKLMGVYIVDTIDPQQQEEIRRITEQNPNVKLTELLQHFLGVNLNQLGLVFALGAILNWLYYGLMESSPKRATLGKIALGLQVTDMDGNQISFAKASARHFSKYISTITLLIGYIMAGLTEKKQALHDVIAGCLVYRK